MTDSTTNTTRLDFGVKISALINAATSFAVIGTAQVKTSKVLALAAVLQGASTEDVSKRTGIAEGTIKRIAAIARNGVPAREGYKDFTSAAISIRLHDLDWISLTTDGADANAQLDATYYAAAIWDDVFVEVAKPGKGRKSEPLSATDLAILVHDTITAAASPLSFFSAVVDALKTTVTSSDNPDVMIDALNDALASIEATLTEGTEEAA